MKLLLLSIFSIFSWGIISAQEVDSVAINQDNTDSLIVTQELADPDTLPEVEPQLIKPALSFDYGKLVSTLAGFDEKYEAGLSLLLLEQYLIVGEIGSAVLQPENAFVNGVYRSEGHYYRLGGGYIRQFNPTSKLGLGALYSYSSFDQRGEVFLDSEFDVQGDVNRTFNHTGAEARWLEIFITSESWLRLNRQNPSSPINRRFALGFQLRSRFLISRDSFDLFDVYAIPGYGRVINDPQLALTLFVKFYPF